MSTRVRWSVIALYVPLAVVALNAPWLDLRAQSVARMFEAPRLGPRARPSERPIRPHQARKARLRLEALDSPALVLNLFDNAERVVTRTKVERPDGDRYIWHGKTDDDGIVTFAVVNGVATGTVFMDDRSFEITTDPDGDYTISELNAAAFPAATPVEAADEAGDVVAMESDTAAEPTMEADGATVIDVMVVWTPAARAAAGGTSAIQSLVLSSVANANLAYANSQVNARLRLVHSAEVAFTEGAILSDLSSLRGTTDGKIDDVHSLRNQYGADIVTLVGSGYAAAGSCGQGYLMASPSTAYAAYAFNIVDRTCAAGALSYTHEVGHNQGLQHDPGSASSSPSRPYAYGYQDPGNAFRTVLAYGGATRVPYFSNPAVTYNGRVTGTSTQDNARALNDNASVVSGFRGAASATPCSYTVSPGSFSFSKEADTASVTVTTTSACSWSSSSGSAWATVSGSKTGSGTAVVSVTANSAAGRTATLTVAGKSISLSQASGCTYAVSPTSLSFSKAAGTASVTVSTASACSWSASSPAAWATATGAGTGSGTAVVAVTANSAASRTATVTVAGKSITVSQAAAAPCSYTVSPTALSFSKAAATASVTVSTTAACAWSAASPVAWAKVTGSRTGSGTAVVSVAANSGNKRAATLVVAGKIVTVSQASGCSFTVSPIALSYTKGASTKSVAVTTTSACTWTSSSTSTWAKVTGGRTGSGTAVVSVTTNAAMARKATVVVAGKNVTVSQATGCVYTVSPTSLSFTKAGGTKTVKVVTTAACKWSPSSPKSWAAVSGARSGSGLATVKVAANAGGSRSLTLKVASKSVVLRQAGQ